MSGPVDQLKLAPDERFRQFAPNVQAALLRIGRRIGEGFEGEIVVASKSHGINYIRWISTEHGRDIREEL